MFFFLRKTFAFNDEAMFSLGTRIETSQLRHFIFIYNEKKNKGSGFSQLYEVGYLGKNNVTN